MNTNLTISSSKRHQDSMRQRQVFVNIRHFMLIRNNENENENDDICLFIFQNKFRNIVVTNIAFLIESKNCEKIANEKFLKKNSQNKIVAMTQTIRREKIVETCEK